MTELSSGVTEDLVEKLAIHLYEQDSQSDEPWSVHSDGFREGRRESARAVLAAVVPEVRRQVAEEIAVALEQFENDEHRDSAGMSLLDLSPAARIAREIGGVE